MSSSGVAPANNASPGGGAGGTAGSMPAGTGGTGGTGGLGGADELPPDAAADARALKPGEGVVRGRPDAASPVDAPVLAPDTSAGAGGASGADVGAGGTGGLPADAAPDLAITPDVAADVAIDAPVDARRPAADIAHDVAVPVDARIVDMGGAGGSTGTGCDTPNLVWKSANKTYFTSYPAPGSEECIVYSGCMYEGQFSACNGTKSKAWVMSHNIVSFFPAFNTYKLHDLCLKSGSKTIVVTVLDTCADSDCSGCCTQNKGSADALIDIESYTDARWGVPDGRIQWADLGPTKTAGCN